MKKFLGMATGWKLWLLIVLLMSWRLGLRSWGWCILRLKVWVVNFGVAHIWAPLLPHLTPGPFKRRGVTLRLISVVMGGRLSGFTAPHPQPLSSRRGVTLRSSFVVRDSFASQWRIAAPRNNYFQKILKLFWIANFYCAIIVFLCSMREKKCFKEQCLKRQIYSLTLN